MCVSLLHFPLPVAPVETRERCGVTILKTHTGLYSETAKSSTMLVSLASMLNG